MRGEFHWWVVTSWNGSGCQEDEAAEEVCEGTYPSTGTKKGKVRKPQVIGCGRGGPLLRNNGPRQKKRIALTFDDGPGTGTGAVLGVLRKFQAKATFFVLGSKIHGRSKLLRRMLQEGNEIGNHSLNHSAFPGLGQLVETNKSIRKATRFKPCLFRPPYGSVNSGLVDRARSAGMMTIRWDVDPRDWAMPGAGAIAGNVVGNAHGGSIVVMHDGGGYRSQTVAALRAILKKLRSRGYKFVTVSRLLGHRQILR